MTILDANILLYAYNADFPQHAATAAWVNSLFVRGETIGLPWSTIWAFLRITTNPRIWANPLSVEQAFERVREWFAEPAVAVIHPGPRHSSILEHLIIEGRASGALVSDAALAAIAIEYGAVLASTDRDFTRFPGLHWINPLA